MYPRIPGHFNFNTWQTKITWYREYYLVLHPGGFSGRTSVSKIEQCMQRSLESDMATSLGTPEVVNIQKGHGTPHHLW